jgi:predicted DNA-binding transcriptional regulator AlpA
MRNIDPPPQHDPLIGIHAVMHLTSLSRTTVARLVKAGRFPAGRQLTPGGRRVGWLTSEVNEWAAAPLDWGPDQINF